MVWTNTACTCWPAFCPARPPAAADQPLLPTTPLFSYQSVPPTPPPASCLLSGCMAVLPTYLTNYLPACLPLPALRLLAYMRGHWPAADYDYDGDFSGSATTLTSNTPVILFTGRQGGRKLKLLEGMGCTTASNEEDVRREPAPLMLTPAAPGVSNAAAPSPCPQPGLSWQPPGWSPPPPSPCMPAHAQA